MARLIAVWLLAVGCVLLSNTSWAQPGGGGGFEEEGPIPCDNKCRMRFDFYYCNAGPGKHTCITYTVETCGECVYGGLCRDNGDYKVLFPNCFAPGGDPKVVTYRHSECDPQCDCANAQTVEGKNHGTNVMELTPRATCQP